MKDFRGVDPAVIALVLLSAAATWVLIGNFGVRLAASTADDSPVIFARFLVEPGFLSGDVITSYARLYALGTVVNWGPALLLRYFGLTPEISSLGIVYLQNMLLPLAVWTLARAAGESRETAWAAAFFAVAAEIYLWNLANFRGQMAIPYAAHLVLPVLIFASAAAVAGRKLRIAVLLAIAATIHPTMTLLALPAIGAPLVWPDKRRITREQLRNITITVAPVALLLVVTAVLVRGGGSDMMSKEQQVAAMRGNVHMNPFGAAMFWKLRLPTQATVLCLVAVFASRLRVLHPAYARVVATALLLVFIYAAAHVLGVLLGVTSLMTLIPLRFTMIFATLALPLMIGGLLEKLRTTDRAQAWAAASLLILHPLMPVGLYWPALVVLLVAAAPWKASRHGRSIRAIILIAWIAALAGLATNLLADVRALSAVTLIAPPIAVGAVAVAGLIALLGPTTRVRAFMVLLPLLLLQRNAAKAATALDGTDRAIYAAQLWARANTSVDATFIIEPNVAWRAVSQRRAIPLWPADSHVYSGSLKSLEYGRAVRDHVTRRPFIHESDVLAFQSRFGGDYLVRFAQRPAMFEPVFRNDEFAIYRLPR